jgi:predicted acylesterase/phospholipase RssA
MIRCSPQYYADGGISNKTPIKSILRFGAPDELFVVNTYPSYPNMTVQSVRANFPNVFSLLMRTALELLPNLYFLRDMDSVRDVNNDLGTWDSMSGQLLAAAPDAATRERLGEVLRQAEGRFSFKRGGKQIVEPVIIAPDEELPVQDTEFVQPKLGETFEMGKAKARSVLAALPPSEVRRRP